MRRLKRVPQRTCVACRQVRPKGELLRVVRGVEGDVLVDPSGKAAGRGAYVCRREQCAEQAVKQKKLARALGARVGPEVLERIAEVLRQPGRQQRGGSGEVPTASGGLDDEGPGDRASVS